MSLENKLLKTRKLSVLFSKQRNAVRLSRLRKFFYYKLHPSQSSAIPIFVMGAQRSGTTMLMDVLHLRPDTRGFSESQHSSAFRDFQLRSPTRIAKIIEDSRAPFVCFKPIADSHRILDLRDAFTHAYFVWIYRQYLDVANSRLRKFDNPTRAIRLVCQGLPGGGWFDTGVPKATRQILRQLPYNDLTDFDFACLAWWTRNRIFEEHKLWTLPNVILLRYENIVSQPERELAILKDRIGLAGHPQSVRFIHDHSVQRDEAPSIHGDVRDLCDSLLALLDTCHQRATGVDN